MPKPLYVRATSGHAGKGICDAARGYLLPEKFTGELAHGSWLANVDSIAANGLLAGGIVGDRANNHFSVCDWRGQPATAFVRSPSFTGPEKVPHEPRPNCDAIFLFNYDLICEMGLEPRMNRKRSVTTKCGESVPPECLEAVFCLITGACYYFKTRFSDKYPHLKAVKRSPVELGKPRGSAQTAPPSTAASSSTDIIAPREGELAPDATDSSTFGWGDVVAALNAPSADKATCLQCDRDAPLGVVYCTRCGSIMLNCPISFEALEAQDDADKERLIRNLGFALKTIQPIVLPDGNIRHMRGARKKADNLTWEERCKKPAEGARRKGFSSIVDRWDRQPSYHANVNEQSMDYWNKPATRETAVSMDMANARLSRQIIPMRARDRDLMLPRERIVSTCSGGSNSQRLRGTPEYHEACNLLEMPGHSEAITRQQGRLELAELAISRELNINPPPPAAPREGLPANGKGKPDLWHNYEAQKGSSRQSRWRQESWEDSGNWWSGSASSSYTGRHGHNPYSSWKGK